MWYHNPSRNVFRASFAEYFLSRSSILNKHKIPLHFSSYNDYDSMLKEVGTKPPRNFNFARDVIDKHAKDPNIGRKLAFYYVSNDESVTKWSFKDLSDESKLFANSLRSLGTIDRAILILPKVPEWWVLNVAALRNNTILMPVGVSN